MHGEWRNKLYQMGVGSRILNPIAFRAPLLDGEPLTGAARAVWVDQVAEEDRHGYAWICPGCGGRMHPVLKHDSPHFAHNRKASCERGGESALHLAAKEHVFGLLKALGPDEVLVRNKDKTQAVTGRDILSVRMEAHQVFADRLKVNGRPETYRPDILVELRDGRKIFVEILVWSVSSEAKIRTGVPILEIRVEWWDFMRRKSLRGMGWMEFNLEALFPERLVSPREARDCKLMNMRAIMKDLGKVFPEDSNLAKVLKEEPSGRVARFYDFSRGADYSWPSFHYAVHVGYLGGLIDLIMMGDLEFLRWTDAKGNQKSLTGGDISSFHGPVYKSFEERILARSFPETYMWDGLIVLKSGKSIIVEIEVSDLCKPRTDQHPCLVFDRDFALRPIAQQIEPPYMRSYNLNQIFGRD